MMEASACDVPVKIGKVFLDMNIIEMELNPRIIGTKVAQLQAVDELICLRALVF
jgi:hypothetical protein